MLLKLNSNHCCVYRIRLLHLIFFRQSLLAKLLIGTYATTQINHDNIGNAYDN